MRRLMTKADRAAARHIPPNSEPVPHPRGAHVAIVYTTDREVNTPQKGPQMHYSAVAYRGTAAHAAWNYYYRTPEQRAAKIAEFFSECDRAETFRAERRQQRNAETSPFAAPPTAEPVRLTTAATAQEVRATLAKAYPRTKFSVRSSEYSQGSSIDVHWTDGPTAAQVETILDCFESAGFDGMTDSKTYRGPSRWRGYRVNWGADYVHGSRSESFALLKAAALEVAFRCELPLLEISEEKGYPHVKDGGRAVAWCLYKKDNPDPAGVSPMGFAQNSHRSEQYDQLIYQYARSISMEQPQPHELPEREPEKPPTPPAPRPNPTADAAAAALRRLESPQPGSSEYNELRAKVEAALLLHPGSRVVN